MSAGELDGWLAQRLAEAEARSRESLARRLEALEDRRRGKTPAASFPHAVTTPARPSPPGLTPPRPAAPQSPAAGQQSPLASAPQSPPAAAHTPPAAATPESRCWKGSPQSRSAALRARARELVKRRRECGGVLQRAPGVAVSPGPVHPSPWHGVAARSQAASAVAAALSPPAVPAPQPAAREAPCVASYAAAEPPPPPGSPWKALAAELESAERRATAAAAIIQAHHPAVRCSPDRAARARAAAAFRALNDQREHAERTAAERRQALLAGAAARIDAFCARKQIGSSASDRERAVMRLARERSAALRQEKERRDSDRERRLREDEELQRERRARYLCQLADRLDSRAKSPPKRRLTAPPPPRSASVEPPRPAPKRGAVKRSGSASKPPPQSNPPTRVSAIRRSPSRVSLGAVGERQRKRAGQMAAVRALRQSASAAGELVPDDECSIEVVPVNLFDSAHDTALFSDPTSPSVATAGG